MSCPLCTKPSAPAKPKPANGDKSGRERSGLAGPPGRQVRNPGAHRVKGIIAAIRAKVGRRARPARAAPRLGREIPRSVVVPQKQRPQGLWISGRVFDKIAVELFGGERRDFLPKPVQLRRLLFLTSGGGAGEKQAVDDLLHRDVAGQVPQRPVHQGVDVHVPEDAMHHQVEIVPDRLFLLLLVAQKDVPGIVIQPLSVGGAGARRGGKYEFTQGGVPKAPG